MFSRKLQCERWGVRSEKKVWGERLHSGRGRSSDLTHPTSLSLLALFMFGEFIGVSSWVLDRVLMTPMAETQQKWQVLWKCDCLLKYLSHLQCPSYTGQLSLIRPATSLPRKADCKLPEGTVWIPSSLHPTPGITFSTPWVHRWLSNKGRGKEGLNN